MKRPLRLLLLGLAACAGPAASDTDTPPAAPAAATPDTAPPAAADAGAAAPAATPAPAPAPADTNPPAPTPATSEAPPPADTTPPAAAPAAADAAPPQPPPAATFTPPPPLPDTGPLPEVKDAGLGYPSAEAALAALRQKPGARVIEQDGWTTVEDQQDPQHLALWAFTPPGHPAHPAMIERLFYARDGRVWMNMLVKCGGSKAACDALVRQYEAMNDGLTREAREQVRKAALPPPAAVAETTPTPAAPAPMPTPPAAPAPPSAPAITRYAAGDLSSQALARECPGHHVEWLGTGQFPLLLSGFDNTLSPATRNRAARLADAPHRLEAYRQLGLLHRFVVYSCAQVQCEQPGKCSHAPQ